MATIELSGIVKRYGDDATVVRGLDLTIADGEFVVLIGPSGCGKSTTLRMIAGLETITEGELRIDGKRVNDTPPGDRDLAMVFQSYALYPHMTVRNNISFGLRVRKVATAEINKRVDDVAEMLGLGELLHRLPAQLSGGQRQRVAMGRAIVRHPKAFLFDEPLSNLDAKLRADVRAEIARLRRTLGITTVYVTHDQIEAMTLADRVVVLHEGVAQQVGPPMEVYRKPANLFVASFLGSPTINLLEGSASAGKFEIPQADAVVLEGLSGDAVCIGVRPHDMHASTTATTGSDVSVGKMTVDVIERLGAESFAFGSLGGRRIAALLDEEAMNVSHGDDIYLSCPPDRVLSFDAKGERLTA